jgi:signal transduction histidine kinase
MVWNWLRRHPALVDWALVLVALTLQVGNALAHSHKALGLGFAVLQALPLACRRRWPVLVLALITAGAFGAAVVQSGQFPLALFIAVYTVAAHADRRRSAWATAAVVVAMTIAYAIAGSFAYPALVLFVATWVFGDNMRTRRAYFAELEEKAEHLEREREANVKRAAAEEQARISRELHDVIAHNVSVMTVQAAAARDVFDADPARAREALASIEKTGRAALTELRRLLGSVREGGRPELAPQPGLGAVDELVGQVRSAGLDVHLSVEGDRTPLPEALDLSAYRIVQEALTNTLKHASAHRAWVDIRYTPSAVQVSVRDDGSGESVTNGGGGRGLVGMRERVDLFGGELEAGPSVGGGFRVSARLPIGGGG